MDGDYGSSDEILNEVATEIPETAPTVSTPEPAKPQMFKYKSGGKEIEEPLDTILKRASQGYNYSQRMQEFNRELDRYKKIEEENKNLTRWREYDEYAQKNPKWNEHVQSMWDAREQALNGNMPEDVDPKVLAAIEAKIEAKYGERFKKYDDHFQLTEKERELEKAYIEDQELDDEIGKIRQSYPDIDFDKTDEHGQTLVQQICVYGTKEGMKTFTPAFRAYYHDQLILREREKAKEDRTKEEQDQKKKGIIGKSQLPMMNGKGSKAQNVRHKSYDDLAREGLEELS